VVCGLLPVVYRGYDFSLLDPIPNSHFASHDSIYRRAQDSARVAFGLSAVGLGRAAPEDTAEGVTAAGLDHGVAVLSGAESGPKSDVQKRADGEGFGRLFRQARVYHDRFARTGHERVIENARSWVHEDGDVPRFERGLQLVRRNKAGGHSLHGACSFVNGLRERHGTTHGQRLGQFENDDGESHAVQAQGNTGGQVAAAAQEDQVNFILFEARAVQCASRF
jgi:hypothetical protein